MVKRTVLPNGLRVISEAVPTVKSIALGIWINAGSRDETKNSSGISHFLEHMVFKGTEQRTALEIAQSLEHRGGHLNAFTSREQICFYAKFIDLDLSLAVDVLSDMLLSPTFDPLEIEKEKMVILEEIKGVEDNPEEFVHDLFASCMWGEHPLGWPIYGFKKQVVSFQQKDLRKKLKELLSPQQIVVAAAGNLEHEKIVELIGEKMSFPFAGQVQREVPNHFDRKVQTVYKTIEQSNLCLGTRAYAFTDRRKYPLILLNTILGDGMSSRLFQKIREELGLSYSIYSFVEFFQDSGVFGIYVGTDKNKVSKSLQQVMLEMTRFRKEGISPEELEFAKTHLIGNLYMGLESTNSRMTRLAKLELYLNEYEDVEKTVTDIKKVTVEEIRGVIEDLFVAEKITGVHLGPKLKHAIDAKNFAMLN